MLTKIQPKRGHKTGIREQFNFDAIALPAFIPNLFECASLTAPRPLGSLDSLFARPLFDPKGDPLSANGRGGTGRWRVSRAIIRFWYERSEILIKWDPFFSVFAHYLCSPVAGLRPPRMGTAPTHDQTGLEQNMVLRRALMVDLSQ